jgi:hypothetical protein
MRVLECADYVAVNMCEGEWCVIKLPYGVHQFGDIIDTQEHNQILMESNQPIVLDHEYLARDEHGNFIKGW